MTIGSIHGTANSAWFRWTVAAVGALQCDQ